MPLGDLRIRTLGIRVPPGDRLVDPSDVWEPFDCCEAGRAGYLAVVVALATAATSRTMRAVLVIRGLSIAG